MNHRSNNELADLCKSNNLSLATLQEKINTIGPRVSSQNQICFHQACSNENVNLEIVQLLYNILPEALRLRDGIDRLPIHRLCCNKGLDDTNSLDILRFMLEIDPNLLMEVGDGGCLPLNLAVQCKSTSFCKELIDACPESLRVASRFGKLPIHVACAYGKRDDTADTIQYILDLDPELINAADNNRCLPIHWAAVGGRTKSIELLLKFDPDAASKETNDGHRRLPLHLACRFSTNLSSTIQALYDAYPEAILISDEDGDTPIDHATSAIIIDFLETQLVYARQAQDMTAMTTIDDDGCLPLLRALKDNVPLGSVKLLTRANPAALQVAADQNGAYPLHIACEFSSVKVVKYLVELAEVDMLNNIDAKNNSLLHYACRGGKCDVVKYLLEANVPSVSDRNNNNKLAIHLLFECGENTLDRESMEYVETVRQLLLANPEVVRDCMPY